MSKGRMRARAALITFTLALSLLINGCSLFPDNNRSNRPGPVRFKTNQDRKVIPTIPIRPTKIGRALRVLPTKIGGKVRVLPTKIGGKLRVLPTKIGGKVRVLPTKIGRELKKLSKMTPIPTPKK